MKSLVGIKSWREEGQGANLKMIAWVVLTLLLFQQFILTGDVLARWLVSPSWVGASEHGGCNRLFVSSNPLRMVLYLPTSVRTSQQTVEAGNRCHSCGGHTSGAAPLQASQRFVLSEKTCRVTMYRQPETNPEKPAVWGRRFWQWEELPLQSNSCGLPRKRIIQGWHTNPAKILA